MGDKMKHQAEETLGKAKEKLGDSSDDPNLQAQGSQEQSDAELKQAGDKAREATDDK